MQFKAIKNFNKQQKELATEYIKGSIKYPLRFLNILMLTGMPASDAQILLMNIRNGFRRSGDVKIRRQLLHILDELINICTSDTTIYSRLRTMAMNGQIGGLKEDVKFYLNSLGINNNRDLTEDVRKKLGHIIKFQEEVQGVAGTGLGTAYDTKGWGYDPKLGSGLIVRRGNNLRGNKRRK